MDGGLFDKKEAIFYKAVTEIHQARIGFVKKGKMQQIF